MNIYAKSICKERVKMLKQCFDNVREKHPLVHNITNYVTVNDVANILLACGGSDYGGRFWRSGRYYFYLSGIEY